MNRDELVKELADWIEPEVIAECVVDRIEDAGYTEPAEVMLIAKKLWLSQLVQLSEDISRRHVDEIVTEYGEYSG